MRAGDYWVHIEGDGPPLVLLHGFAGSHMTWLPHLPIFSRYLQVIAPDLPGHGDTTAQRFQMNEAADDLVAALAALGISRFHLLGYSMGGRLALYLATYHLDRVQSLILESASPGLSSPDERRARAERDEQLAQDIERDGLAAFVSRWERLPLFATQTDAMRDAVRPIRLGQTAAGLAASLRGMGTGVQPSLWDHLAAVEAPTLLIAGELDAKYAAIARQMAAALPKARVEIVQGAGHTVHLERPAVFQRLVLSHLTI